MVRLTRKTGMNADAGYGGLRAKRCLSAKFHAKTAHTTYQSDQTGSLTRTSTEPILLQVSPSHGDHNLCLKQRQLTLLYRLLPQLCRIGAKP